MKYFGLIFVIMMFVGCGFESEVEIELPETEKYMTYQGEEIQFSEEEKGLLAISVYPEQVGYPDEIQKPYKFILDPKEETYESNDDLPTWFDISDFIENYEIKEREV